MKQLLLLTIVFFIFPFFRLQSQTLAGGEIYYELISAKKYKITAHLYRMCDQAPLNTLNASVYGGTTTVAMSFQRIAISRINDTCGNPCNKQNAVSNAGFEKHTYIDTVDFNYAPFDVFVTKNICTVNFGIRNGGRFSNITTLNAGTFYLDAAVNLCLSGITKNTSPQFSMEPKFYTMCNWPLNYSPGPVDSTDNDSFSFSLSDVESNYNTPVTYKGAFNSQTPMTPFCLPSGISCSAIPNAKPPRGFYLDKLNGTIVFTPYNCSETGTIKYKISEYRFNPQTGKHDWLGYVTREMTLQVVKSPGNTPPSISPSVNLNVCEGNKVCLTISTTDSRTSFQNTDDTTTLFWDQAINGANFRITDPGAREKAGEFCWQTKRNGNRREDYFFTVAAYDKQCNVDLVSRSYNVNVESGHNYSRKSSAGACGLVRWAISATDSLYPNYKPTVNTVLRSFTTNAVLYSGNRLVDSVYLHENGKIILEHTLNLICPVVVRDTLTVVNAIPIPDVNDNANAFICGNTLNSFYFKAYRIPDLSSFKWYLNDSLVNHSDTVLSTMITANTNIRLEVKNKSGCVAGRTLTYTLKQHDVLANVNFKICRGSDITVNAINNGLLRPLSYLWNINGVDTSVTDSFLNLKITKDSKVSLILKDADQCPFKDSVFANILPDVFFRLQTPALVCRDSLTLVKADLIKAAGPFIFDWAINGVTVSNNDSTLKINRAGNSLVKLKMTDNNKCSHSEVIPINTLPTPEVVLTQNAQTCYNGTLNITPQVNNRPADIYYQWSFNKAVISTDSVLKRTFTSSQEIRLKVRNSLNCSTEDTVSIKVFSLPLFSIIHNGYYHPSSLIIAGTTGKFKTYQWFNGKTTASDTFWAADLGAPGKHKIWCRVTDDNGCTNTDTSLVYTDQFMSVLHSDHEEIKMYPNPVKDILTVLIPLDTEVSIFAPDGRICARYTLRSGENRIDLSGLAEGVYFIRTGHTMVKVVKE